MDTNFPTNLWQHNTCSQSGKLDASLYMCCACMKFTPCIFPAFGSLIAELVSCMLIYFLFLCIVSVTVYRQQLS
jgi:hypothetical protein